MIYDLKGKSPRLSDNVFVADSAAVVGDVELGENVSVWFGAAIRGDEGSIEIGDNTNIQDNATVHSKTKIGRGVTIGHNAIVHGCTVGDNVLVGMGAIVLDGAEIGKDSIIGAGALVTGNKKFPPRSLILGSPASVKRELSDGEVDSIRHNAKEYIELIEKYR